MPNPWDRPAAAAQGNPWDRPAAATPAPQAAAQESAPPPPSTLSRLGGAALDVAKGVGEGAVHTMAGADDWASKHLPTWMTTPLGQEATPENSARATAYAKQLEKPTNTAQSIGKLGEQAAEFMVPGGAEEKAASALTPMLAKVPGLAKAAPTLTKMGVSALGAGSVNALQGGSFAGGAAGGAVGAGIGAGLKRIAPVVAETALKVRGTDRAYGRTPGQAILSETKGFSPRGIADQAAVKVGEYSNQLEDMARDSPNGASLAPAREAATSAIDAAYGRNNKATYDKLIKMGHQLDTNLDGQEIPEITSPQQLLHLKRGIGDLQTSWNPATQPKWVNGQVGSVYHALDSELDRALPEGAALNQKISTLMPVEQRANAADLNAGFLQSTLGRFSAHTGALVGGGAGAGFGYSRGGVPGAILGGVAGVLGPEVVASPEAQMMAARTFNAPAMRKIAIPLARGSAMQAGRPGVFSNQSE